MPALHYEWSNVLTIIVSNSNMFYFTMLHSPLSNIILQKFKNSKLYNLNCCKLVEVLLGHLDYVITGKQEEISHYLWYHTNNHMEAFIKTRQTDTPEKTIGINMKNHRVYADVLAFLRLFVWSSVLAENILVCPVVACRDGINQFNQ